jgi:hypothetical protein
MTARTVTTSRSRRRAGIPVLATLVAGAAIVAACADASGADPAHPADFIGRWVRLRQDRTWGDTMEFVADGSMRGSAGYPVPPMLHWDVRRDSSGTSQYCAMQGTMGFCRSYRLNGDTLELLGGLQGSTLFRRVR